MTKEYNDRWNKPLVNPPFTPGSVSGGGNTSLPIIDVGKPADVADVAGKPSRMHPWRLKTAIGVAKAKAFHKGV